MIVESNSAENTFEIARGIGQSAAKGQVFALSGDLGVGKTVFAKGFAAGLGIADPMAVNSPTFTILQEYEDGRIPLYHYDVYRIEDPEELYEVGVEDYFFGDGVCLIEWAERVEELLPKETKWIRIEKDPEKGLDFRRISMEVAQDGGRMGEDEK